MTTSNPIDINNNFGLFKDNGVRYIKNIVLSVRYNSESIKELIDTSCNISKFYNAKLTILHVIPEDIEDIEINNIKLRTSSYLSKNNIVNDDIKIRVISSNDHIQSISNISILNDLLIVGTPKQDTLKRMLFGTGKDKIITSSTCSVLRLSIRKG